MKPQEYEQYVASLFQEKGYETIVTPQSGDYGIDVIASKGDEKIAIQAKMYGHTSRKVNRAAIMELHGAMAYQHCTKAILATDGELLEDAIKVAKELNIEILYTSPMTTKTEPEKKEEQPQNNNEVTQNLALPFDKVWKEFIMPLKGSTIKTATGLDNRILDVNNAGITRITSTGNTGKIGIEGFKFAYYTLIKDGKVTRDYINQQSNKRCSSGIVAILSNLPFVDLGTNSTLILNKQAFKEYT